jgi:hypothetical protein
MGRRFFLPACPAAKIDLCHTGINLIIVVNPNGSGMAGYRLSSPRRGSWETLGAGATGAMKTNRGRWEGQKVSPQPFAGLETLRHKKTPHASGAQKLKNYYIRKRENINPLRSFF